ncbi:ankyrin repeat protein, putative [Trichomonas vaginalis G3]|uniref:Ankyrin repeat protein, putative n=1 Tax=Trichomonas vaginalis (strain ATCC PRA-98 / G3) TaxID=412133 RepID=A2D8I6_TRIV3|nr:ankyrin repeat and SOCS box-containing protein 4 family [Trichomonas vaginalis G3]EAY23235.1 ankyrin repeat protein, putative [Trichomonas vaginalis G3]KAI5534116.1 ankyrin repeat and SOCS box-containing protein 4 family [Trichomonas vaginalis G3]|eukprot:XP_001584221.1 ankyrin repeat protein [Trichomonas vaginalis G3]
MNQQIPVDIDFYNQMMELCQDYVECTTSLYKLHSLDDDRIDEIYNLIKANLIDSKILSPHKLINIICEVYKYNNRYIRSYFKILKKIFDDYKINPISVLNRLNLYLYCKEYGIRIHESFKSKESLDIHEENTIYKAIMDDDKDSFVVFTEREQFDENQKLENSLYPVKTNSLLELCCYHGAVNCFKILMTKFTLEITNLCLHYSFLSGNPEIMNECLKYVTPDQKCMKYAIISHNLDFITFLMNKYNLKIDPEDCRQNNNIQAFFVYVNEYNDLNKCFPHCSAFQIKSLFEYFLSHGVDINSKDEKDDKTALHYALKFKDDKEFIEFLISRGADIHLKDSLGRIALFYAIESSNKELVEYLISQGSDINAKDQKGRSPLHCAVTFNRKEIVEMIVSHGADLNAKDNYFENTALHLAVTFKFPYITEYLVSQGIDINAVNRDEETPLMKAANNGSIKDAEILLKYGADIDCRTVFQEQSAIHLAVLKGNIAFVELLLKYGSSLYEKDIDGRNALHYAVISGNDSMLEYVIEHTDGINRPDYKGKTALHIAAEQGFQQLAAILISNLININSIDGKERTALHLAAINNFPELADLLISNGADINSKDHKGRTALHLAVLNNCPEMLNFLIAHGIDINATNNKGMTALNVAEEYALTSFIQFLQYHGAIRYEIESDSSDSFSEYDS